MPQSQTSTSGPSDKRVRVYRVSDGAEGTLPADQVAEALQSGEYSITKPTGTEKFGAALARRGKTPAGRRFAANLLEEAIVNPALGLYGLAKEPFAMLRNILTPENAKPTLVEHLIDAQIGEYQKGAEAAARKDPFAARLHALTTLLPILGPPVAARIEQIRGGDVAGGAGGLTGMAAQIASGRIGQALPESTATVNIGGKPFPATVGTRTPGSALASAESFLEGVPLLGRPIRKKLELIREEGKRRIGETAIEQSPLRGSRGAAENFIDDTVAAGRAFKNDARQIYQKLIPDARDSSKFIELQGERTELIRVMNSKSSTIANKNDARREIRNVERKMHLLLNKYGRSWDDFAEANALFARGSAMEDFAAQLSATTKGIKPGQQAGGAAPQPQRIMTASLVERVKKMDSSGRLLQAFGKDGAEQIKQIVDQLDRAKLSPKTQARFRELLTHGFAFGVGGITLVNPTVGAFVGAGSYILSKALASGSGRVFLKNFLKSAAGSQEAAFWAARIGALVRGEPGAEIYTEEEEKQ